MKTLFESVRLNNWNIVELSVIKYGLGDLCKTGLEALRLVEFNPGNEFHIYFGVVDNSLNLAKIVLVKTRLNSYPLTLDRPYEV